MFYAPNASATWWCAGHLPRGRGCAMTESVTIALQNYFIFLNAETFRQEKCIAKVFFLNFADTYKKKGHPITRVPQT